MIDFRNEETRYLMLLCMHCNGELCNDPTIEIIHYMIVIRLVKQ